MPPLNWHRGYLALADHDDILAPHAMYTMGKAIAQLRAEGKPDGFLYSDEALFTKRSKSRWWPTSSPITPRITCSVATTSAIWPCSGESCSSRWAGTPRM